MDSVYIEIQRALISKAESVKSTTQSVNGQKVISSIDINSIISNATLKYCKSNKVLSINNKTCSKTVNNTAKRSSVKSEFPDSILMSENLNPIQKEYIDRIFSVIKSDFNKTDLSEMKNKLEKINKDAESKMNEREVQCIYIASSIAYASTQYWQKNIPKWYALLKADEISEKYKNKLSQKTRFKAKAYELPEIVVTADSPWWMDCMEWWTNFGAPLVGSDVGAGIGSGMTTIYGSGGTALLVWEVVAADAAAGALAGSATYCGYRLFAN